jgi:hypothetical protein
VALPAQSMIASKSIMHVRRAVVENDGMVFLIDPVELFTRDVGDDGVIDHVEVE